MNENTNELPFYTWPGAYPLVYFDDDGNTLCASCATEATEDGETFNSFVHWEGPPIYCEDCGVVLDSAYGDPDSDDDGLTDA